MIVSASYRTDIPAFYAAWFRERLRAGFCRVANPYGGPDYRVSLARRDVDGFVFWTRNTRPFLPTLDEIAEIGLPFVVQFTITGYPRPLEPSVIKAEAAVSQVARLASRFGPRAVVWRYDPVFVTDQTGPDWHREQVAALARRLAGSSDEVVFSFAQIYAKTRANSDRAAERHGFSWLDPESEEKKALLRDLADIARAEGFKPSLCAQPELLDAPLEAASCIDAARLEDVAGRPLKTRVKGNRPGCFCAESRDIGAYDTCPHGCVYCYAVRRPELAKKRHREHDPAAERL